MDFLTYLIFIFVGSIVGAAFGLRTMNWYWSGAKTAAKDDAKFYLLLLLAVIYIVGRRGYW